MTPIECVSVIVGAIVINVLGFFWRNSKGLDNEVLMYISGLAAGLGLAALAIICKIAIGN